MAKEKIVLSKLWKACETQVPYWVRFRLELKPGDYIAWKLLPGEDYVIVTKGRRVPIPRSSDPG